MPETVIYGIIIIIIVLVLWLVITRVLKNKEVSHSLTHVSIDIDRLLDALGGKENIEKMEATNSKASFIIKDRSNIQVDVLKELGATGVVQSNQKVTAIFGKTSKAIIEAIESKQ